MTVFRFCADFFFWQEAGIERHFASFSAGGADSIGHLSGASRGGQKKRKKRRKTASFFVWDPISYRVLRQSIRCNKRLCLRSD